MIFFIIRILKWRLGFSDVREQPHRMEVLYVPEYSKPSLELIHHPDPSKIQITWVGHSTFLIQIEGHHILTDPIWSNRASPVPWFGPKRYARPGISFDDLPKIDVVLISHTHYDHLDRPTVKKLGMLPHYMVPTHVAKWFFKLGIANVTELPWWESKALGNITITAVPAKHWSKRNLWGTSTAGWGGYVIESRRGAIYFAGDTGYHTEYFKEIGKRFARIDLGLIPIGAYYPEFIFGNYHINPREAVMVHKEIRAQRSIGMHWGTFKLTQEPLSEPPQLLAAEAAAAQLQQNEFSTMKIGEMRSL